MKQLLLAICFSLCTLQIALGEPVPGVKPRNVILMIGDGMGLNQLISARAIKGRLNVEDLPYMGASMTHSLRNFVTDSSAGATVLASGYLIVNGEVGVHPDGKPVKLSTEYAREKGKWTGLVATCRVTHATPASMATHVKSRGSEDDIALQLAESGVDVILGGGWDKFLPTRSQKVNADPVPGDPVADAEPVSEQEWGPRTLLASLPRSAAGRTLLTAENPLLWNGVPYGTRTDRRNLIEEMKTRGYRFVRTPQELQGIVAGPPGKLLGLFHSGPMPKASEGRTPGLSALARAALRVLSQSPSGFFLMIEGSQIDWGGHANDFDYAQREAADFDDAIGAVVQFLREEGLERETLLVVTADHETGGLSLNVNAQLPLGLEPKWSTTYHTAAPVPVFSAGPGAERFKGIQSHEKIGRGLIEAIVGEKVQFAYPLDGVSYPGLSGPGREF